MPARDDAEVVLLYLARGYLLVHYAQRLGVLGRYDYAACVAVYAVAQRRGEGVLLTRPPIAALVRMGLDVGNERVVVPLARAVAEYARGLVAQYYIPVLIDDVELRHADLQVRIVLAGDLKELVVYIQAEHVALIQARVPLCALAVELYPLQTDILLQQALGQERHRLANEAVQPLVCVVFSNHYLFHSCIISPRGPLVKYARPGQARKNFSNAGTFPPPYSLKRAAVTAKKTPPLDKENEK